MNDKLGGQEPKIRKIRINPNLSDPGANSTQPAISVNGGFTPVEALPDATFRETKIRPVGQRVAAGSAAGQLDFAGKASSNHAQAEARPRAGQTPVNYANPRKVSPVRPTSEADIFKRDSKTVENKSTVYHRPPENRGRSTSNGRVAPPHRTQAAEATPKTDKRDAVKRDRKRKMIAAVLTVVILVPAIYFAVNALGILSDQVESTETFESIPEYTEEVDQTSVDRESEEYLLAKELTEKDIVYPGVLLAGFSLANYSREAIENELARIGSELDEKGAFMLNIADKHVPVKFSELQISLATEELLEEIWKHGRESENMDPDLRIMERYQEIIELENNPVDIPYRYKYNERVIESSLKELLAPYIQGPVSAKAVSFNESRMNFNIEPETVGVAADLKLITTQITDYLEGRGDSNRIDVKTEISYPDVTEVELKKSVHLLAEASTKVMMQHYGRNSNLKRAAQLLTGQIIQPGETFSYMAALDPITAANGFENASILVSGQYVDGMGGGLCQPSTTLFQAAAKAGLTIIERQNHGRVGDYFKPGMDAMVSGWSDLKFRNDSKQPVAIIMESSTRAVTVRIYGNTMPENMTIKLTAEKIGDDVPPGEAVYKEDPQLAPGKVEQDIKAVAGNSWQTYREYYQNGKLIKKEKLWRSRYNARPNTYRVAVGHIPAGYPGATVTGATTTVKVTETTVAATPTTTKASEAPTATPTTTKTAEVPATTTTTPEPEEDS